MSGCPWLMANLICEETKNYLPGCKPYHIMMHQGIKIGLFGIAEPEWLGLVNPLKFPEIKLEYLDMVEVSKKMSKLLKDEGCEYIIALTHNKTSNDIKLAEQCQGDFNLMLGGHDHTTQFEQIG